MNQTRCLNYLPHIHLTNWPLCSKSGLRYPPEKISIQWIAYWFPQLVDPLDSDLSVGQCYPMFEQLEPEGQMYAELPQNLDH